MNIVLQNACPKAADLDVACTVGADKVWYSIERYVFWLSDDFFTLIGTRNTYIQSMHTHEHMYGYAKCVVWQGNRPHLLWNIQKKCT